MSAHTHSSPQQDPESDDADTGVPITSAEIYGEHQLPYRALADLAFNEIHHSPKIEPWVREFILRRMTPLDGHVLASSLKDEPLACAGELWPLLLAQRNPKERYVAARVLALYGQNARTQDEISRLAEPEYEPTRRALVDLALDIRHFREPKGRTATTAYSLRAQAHLALIGVCEAREVERPVLDALFREGSVEPFHNVSSMRLLSEAIDSRRRTSLTPAGVSRLAEIFHDPLRFPEVYMRAAAIVDRALAVGTHLREQFDAGYGEGVRRIALEVARGVPRVLNGEAELLRYGSALYLLRRFAASDEESAECLRRCVDHPDRAIRAIALLSSYERMPERAGRMMGRLYNTHVGRELAVDLLQWRFDSRAAALQLSSLGTILSTEYALHQSEGPFFESEAGAFPRCVQRVRERVAQDRPDEAVPKFFVRSLEVDNKMARRQFALLMLDPEERETVDLPHWVFESQRIAAKVLSLLHSLTCAESSRADVRQYMERLEEAFSRTSATCFGISYQKVNVAAEDKIEPAK